MTSDHRAVEVCVRCGHVAGTTCPTCGAADPVLGGSLWRNALAGRPHRLPLCHTFVRSGNISCYTQEVADQRAGVGRWAT